MLKLTDRQIGRIKLDSERIERGLWFNLTRRGDIRCRRGRLCHHGIIRRAGHLT